MNFTFDYLHRLREIRRRLFASIVGTLVLHSFADSVGLYARSLHGTSTYRAVRLVEIVLAGCSRRCRRW